MDNKNEKSSINAEHLGEEKNKSEAMENSDEKDVKRSKENNQETGASEVKSPEIKSEDKGKEEVNSEDSSENKSDEGKKSEQRQTDPKPESEPDSTGENKKQDKSPSEDMEAKSVDYSTFGKEQLVNRLHLLIDERPVNEIKKDVDQIKLNFYKKHKAEIEDQKKQFTKEGGELKDFKPGEDPHEEKLKEGLEKYKKKKSDYNKALDERKKENLQEKLKVIEEIKDLVNREESMNKTFQEFRALQNRWKEIGMVPQKNLKNLWGTYHHHVEKFYDYVKINKELRDIDLKKNLETKLKLCEKAEQLLSESNIINAYKVLQKYHDKWREIGPVPRENREELWARFKETTSEINRKHHQHFQEIKDQQKINLQKKTELCEKVEESLKKTDINDPRQWEKIANEIKKIQKTWRTIGFAPRKHNNKIYKRFRDACDTFFNSKRDFYAEHKEVKKNNLKLKMELCDKAEELKESENWKKTTGELIKLQKKWKEIGPVPKKDSEKIWKKFRSFCDEFFDRKSEYYVNKDKIFLDNLEKKTKLINEINEFKPGENNEKNLEKIKKFQQRWADIGFVPFKNKDKIINEYKNAINIQFDNLDIDEHRKNKLRYQNKLDQLTDSPKGNIKAKNDREKFFNKIKKLENDIVVWENNKGFFAKSENAESLIKEVDEKIEQAKENIGLLEEKIQMIDQADI